MFSSEKEEGSPSRFQRITAWSKKNQGAAILLGLLALLFVVPFTVAIVIGLWYVFIPAAIALFVWKKTSQPKRIKIGTALAAVVIAIGLGGYSAHVNRAPVLTITTPESGISIQAKRIEVTGTVSPKDSTVSINSLPATVNPDGTFTGPFLLKTEQNTATIEAKNGGKTSTVTLSVARVFTEEEKAELTAAAEKAKQEQAAREAAEKAAIAEYEKTPEGKACKAHPEWTKDECESLMSGKIWIGMTYSMLTYKRGAPDHKNLSNYGRGSRYQYCWMDYTPSCYYDDNNDGVIDAYN